MTKVTISDFIIALMDLLEAESRALERSASLFMERQRQSWRDTLYRSSWTIAWIVVATGALLGALGFGAWGMYRFLADNLSETAAPFVTAAILLLGAAFFGWIASRLGRSDG